MIKCLRTSTSLQYVLLAFVALATLPPCFSNSYVRAGLDPSWSYFINQFWHAGFVYGRDVIFSYGPFGFLSCPISIGNNLLFANIYAQLQWVLLGVFWLLLVREKVVESDNIDIFLVIFVLFVSGRVMFSNRLFLTMFFVLAISSSRYWKRYFLAASFLAAFFLMIKFNEGFSFWIITTLCFLIRLLSQGCFRSLYLLAVPFLSLYFLYGIIASWSPNNFIDYLRYSWEIASGYSNAMSWSSYYADSIGRGGSGWSELALGLSIIILFSVVPLVVGIRKFTSIRRISLFLAVVIIIFFAFKHGYVRQDGHVTGFPGSVSIVLALYILFTTDKQIKKIVCLPLAVSLIFLIIVNISMSKKPKFFAANLMQKINSYKYCHKIITKNELKVDKRIKVLSRSLLSEIKNAETTIYPWDIAIAAKNKLNFAPIFPVQVYSAYTPLLDKKTSENLVNKKNGPKYIIYDFKAIDGRHPMLEAPETVLNLLKWFNLSCDNNQFLLTRRLKSRFDSINSIHQYEFNSNKWFNVAPSETLLLGKINFQKTLLGTLVNAVFKIPHVYMNIEYLNNQVKRWRVLPENLNGCFLLNVMPSDKKEVMNIFSKDIVRNVKKIKFSGAGLRFYRANTFTCYSVDTVKVNDPVKLYDESRVVLSLQDDLSRMKFINIEKVSRKHGKVVFDTKTDPQIILPDTGFDNICAKIIIDVPRKNILQMFYKVKTNDVFNGEHMLTIKLHKGINYIILDLSTIGAKGDLRIDPVAGSMHFSIHKLEIRS